MIQPSLLTSIVHIAAKEGLGSILRKNIEIRNDAVPHVASQAQIALNKRDGMGRNARWWATYGHELALLKMLHDNGVPMDEPDYRGTLPI